MFVAIQPVDFHFKLLVKMPGIIKLGEVVDNTQFAISFFAVSHLLFQTLAFGDITGHRLKSRNFSIFHNQLSVLSNPNLPAILGDNDIF